MLSWALAFGCAGGAVAAGPRWAVAVLPSGEEFALEVAADAASRARGYMFREEVGPREGMLFIFEETGRHGFWMANCRVRLDIVWLDAALRVVDIAADQAPCRADAPCPTVTPLRPARYALEFAAGTARRHGLKPGDPVVVLSDPPIP